MNPIPTIKWLVDLKPEKLIIAILLIIITVVSVWTYNIREDYKSERDDYKGRYERLYDKYAKYVDKNQENQNNLKDNCQEEFKEYAKERNAEIKALEEDFSKKYFRLLEDYRTLLEKQNKQ